MNFHACLRSLQIPNVMLVRPLLIAVQEIVGKHFYE